MRDHCVVHLRGFARVVDHCCGKLVISRILLFPLTRHLPQDFDSQFFAFQNVNRCRKSQSSTDYACTVFVSLLYLVHYFTKRMFKDAILFSLQVRRGCDVTPSDVWLAVGHDGVAILHPTSLVSV